MAADESAQDAATSDVRLGERALEQLHDDVVALARGYTARPLPEVFRAAKQTRELALRLTDHTRRPSQLSDLHTVAGQACGLLATAAFDMGYWDAAARLADSALTHADIAGHNSLRAWSIGMRAFMANWQGDPHDALNRIEAALTLAPPGTATVRLRAFEARSRALLGEREGTNQAVRAAEAALAATDTHDELHDGVGGEFGYNAAQQALSAGTAYVSLQDGAAAEQQAERALNLYRAFPPERRAYYTEHVTLVDLTSARILRGDLAGAREALRPVFTLPPDRRLAGVTSRLDQARKLLTAAIFRTSTEARQLTSDITDFTVDTAARAIPEADL